VCCWRLLSTQVSWLYLKLDQDFCLPCCFQFLILFGIQSVDVAVWITDSICQWNASVEWESIFRKKSPTSCTNRTSWCSDCVLYHDRERNCRRAILLFLSFFPQCLQRIPKQFTKIGYDHLYVLPNCKRVIWRFITRVVKTLQTPRSCIQRTDSSDFVYWNSQKGTQPRIITLHDHFWSIEGHLWRRRDLEISCTSNI
jgi:hypothetical protein